VCFLLLNSLILFYVLMCDNVSLCLCVLLVVSILVAFVLSMINGFEFRFVFCQFCRVNKFCGKLCF
jgi:hypothetical protein